MSKKLWEKNGTTLDEVIERFTVGKDYLYDLHLALFDIYGSAAHARMLAKIGIMTPGELDAILRGLMGIKTEIDHQSFEMQLEDEDIHTKVENILVKNLGDIGKKLHTARSRNDQILVDIRLYVKSELNRIVLQILDFCTTLTKFAQQYEFTPMPGYTHMQIAMPSSVGMWASSFVENFLDEMRLIEAIYELNNMNPLGSGAGYGTSLEIDREYTTSLLGFSRVQTNSIYCGNSRGKIEANVLSGIASLGLIFNRIASDLLLFTTKEFNFFLYDNAISTGSSIMPQKRNLDVLELIRGRTQLLLSNEAQIKHIIANLPSGYNRDYQDT
ncbi:MAG: argininosuccinate lyase, partial [Candidatus Heimdallarchaeota archaeon]|nr:argininosuccinate lyase [Candidatus Heimdallarchaeota archaeon]